MTTFEHAQADATGGLVDIDGRQYYDIEGVDRMPPFLMSVVSDGDRWMFVSTSGALAAGRRDATQSLFPYVTDDRLHASGGMTGPVTVLRVDGRADTWQPFAALPQPGTRRSVGKTVESDAVRFEEQHAGLGLTFSYRWSSAEQFGFVRTATLTNDGAAAVSVDLVDGLVDLLPYGMEPIVYQRLSNLTNAYKRSEVIDPAAGLALYTLESPVSDQADPEEVLRATAVWSVGLDGALDLHAGSLTALRAGEPVPSRHLVCGLPGSYLRHATLELAPGASATWYVVADVARSQGSVVELQRLLQSGADLVNDLEAACRRTGEHLVEITTPADGDQSTGDPVACAHHRSNVIYNVMRGGVPLDGYRIDIDDFTEFVRVRSTAVAERQGSWLDSLPRQLDRSGLVARVAERGDVHLSRLGDEYLPFSFSRRHGDPSRPWNQFSIRITGDRGEPILYFEGNWRDVFQNWEALCASYPEYLPGVVSLFVNASTADGHNPYRITRDGIDWEVPDPDDPWANIGYWGDHQIVYLLRLLEATESYLPGEIGRRLTARTCTFADVPYRIAPYPDLVADPKSTITFDEDADERSARRVDRMGGDGKLLPGPDGEPVVVTLAEKLVIAALAKVSNLVPGGGIWMNTQRPEWNDANNALVGYGLSMVTLFHLRRFVDHLRGLVSSTDEDIELSVEVAQWLSETAQALELDPDAAVADDRLRRTMLDRLGTAASDYRSAIYRSGLSGETTTVARGDLLAWCDAAIAHLDASARTSRRSDGLVHAYNLVRFPSADTAEVRHLPEMLEGQVAGLTPGLLTPAEQADLLDALFASALRRDDLDTFVLAALERPRPFLEKNLVDAADVDANPLLNELRRAGDESVIVVDPDGAHRFAPDLTTADALEARLDALAARSQWADLVGEHRDATLATYETVFAHQSHLGRSGSMYGYEGLGSIYWHMVTKLLLVTQEAVVDARRAGAPADQLARLVAAYWRVRGGLGVAKSAEEFGAIPIDPYSHSPEHSGAQQPGMTGAVKEEILARRAELGVFVDRGELVVDPLLLRADDVLDHGHRWETLGVDGSRTIIDLPAGSLGLTVCQTPVIVDTTAAEPSIEVEYADGRRVRVDGNRLDAAISAEIFGRTGRVAVIRAAVPMH